MIWQPNLFSGCGRRPLVDDPVRSIMMALRDVTAAMEDRIRDELAPMGLGMPHMIALRRCIMGGPKTVSALAAQAGVTKGAMSPIVQRLVDAGLATRRQDLDDRRIQWIEVTPKATKTKQKVETSVGGLIQTMVSDWDEAHKMRFAEDLATLREKLR